MDVADRTSRGAGSRESWLSDGQDAARRCDLWALDLELVRLAVWSTLWGRAFAESVVTEVVALVMAFNMSVGMAVWMRHRGHPWGRIAEMAGAMVVPALVAIALFWAGAIGISAILALEHVAMIRR